MEPFNVTLDSGSADLWVYANTCKGCAPDLKTFDCLTQSATCYQTPISLGITYDDGPIIGNIAFDTLNIDASVDVGVNYI